MILAWVGGGVALVFAWYVFAAFFLRRFADDMGFHPNDRRNGGAATVWVISPVAIPVFFVVELLPRLLDGIAGKIHDWVCKGVDR